jgi:hypothetical protein
MKNIKVKAGEGSAAVVVKIGSLDELQTRVDAPLICQFAMDGDVIELVCKRVSFELSEQVRALENKVIPPFVEKRGDYDYFDLQYRARKELAKAQGRSLLIYFGCPVVSAKKPGLMNPVDIHKFVSSILSENILEFLAATIQGGGMGVVERTNFTSPSASEN